MIDCNVIINYKMFICFIREIGCLEVFGFVFNLISEFNICF